MGVAAAEQCTFDEERLHTDRYIQRLDVTAHTRTERKIHIQMYVYRRNAALGEECSGTLYTHTHKYIYIFSSVGRCFQRRLMGWAASGVGAGGHAGGRQGAAARVVCVPLSHLKH